MKEKARSPVTPGVLQDFGEKEEVVILDPDEVILRCLGGNHIGELPVYGFVGGKIVTVENRKIEPVVHDRPENAVGVAKVESFIFGLRHVDQRERDAIFIGIQNTATGHVEYLAAPSDPQSARFSERVRERNGESASARAAIGSPVRNGDEARR